MKKGSKTIIGLLLSLLLIVGLSACETKKGTGQLSGQIVKDGEPHSALVVLEGDKSRKKYVESFGEDNNATL